MNTAEQQILDAIDSVKRLSIGDARAKSIAVTHLETALLWVVKSQEGIDNF